MYCPLITVLGLNNNPAITTQGLKVLLDHLAPAIERLYLSNTGISNVTLHQIARQCRTLYSLSVIQCEQITYEGLKHLGNKDCACYYTLQDLHLSECMRDRKHFYRDCVDIPDSGTTGMIRRVALEGLPLMKETHEFYFRPTRSEKWTPIQQ